MADIAVPLKSLTEFRDQATTDLAGAKEREASTKAAWETAVADRVRKEGDVALGKATVDLITGAQAVGAAVEKAEASPKTKWVLLGVGLVLLATIGLAVAKGLHWL